MGLYGGSFNPAHEGHAHVARIALVRLGLDRVIWLVSPQNPLKREGAADLAERMAGARRLARGPAMIVSDLEARLGIRYTVDLVRLMRARYPAVRFVWLMGADNLAGFHRWRGWAEIMRRVPVCVVARPGWALKGSLVAGGAPICLGAAARQRGAAAGAGDAAGVDLPGRAAQFCVIDGDPGAEQARGDRDFRLTADH